MQAVLDSWSRQPARILLQRIVTQANESGVEVPNEALVAAARSCVRAGNDEDAWRIVEILSRRVASRTYRHLAVWGLARTSRHEDVTRDILHMMMECVLSTEPRNEFWECRFWTCFDRRVRTILRDLSHRHRADTVWDEATEREAAEAQPLSASHSDARDWLESVAARSLLERLPEPVRTAFYLKHYAGYKEESPGDEPTIASALHVSGRTVRNYLRKANELLSAWRPVEEGGL